MQMDIQTRLSRVTGDAYDSPLARPGLLTRLFPTLSFYMKISAIVWNGYRCARSGRYTLDYWQLNSQQVMDAVEHIGGVIEIRGLDNLRSVEGPCVIVANHMSTLETFMLPAMVMPIKNFTFVVKKSLTEMPVFSHVMRATMPITVSRTNPRDDLKTVLEQGKAMLASGRSVLIFPQTTRSNAFDPSRFNSIGAKLAARAGVPLVPLALETSLWGTGMLIKDFGPVDASRKVRYRFGPPIAVDARGSEAHERSVEFIKSAIEGWASEGPQQKS